MAANIIVGILFFAIIAFGAFRAFKSMKSNSCPGCSGGCSVEQRKNCKH